MSTHRTWDESLSPQWRYFQEKESVGRKNKRKTSARLRREEQETSLISPTNTDTSTTEKWKDINSELKKEKIKYDIKSTRLSVKSKEQE